MNIIQRNFYRLIRNGLFGHQEIIEPMSAFKWSKLFQLAVMHEVVVPVWQGLQKSKNQFQLHLTQQQWELWEKSVKEYGEKAYKRALTYDPSKYAKALKNILEKV